MLEHKYHQCYGADLNISYCTICEGNLSLCDICGGFEGSLLSSCPGYKLSFETLEACYSGNVIDFQSTHWRRITRKYNAK